MSLNHSHVKTFFLVIVRHVRDGALNQLREMFAETHVQGRVLGYDGEETYQDFDSQDPVFVQGCLVSVLFLTSHCGAG